MRAFVAAYFSRWFGPVWEKMRQIAYTVYPKVQFWDQSSISWQRIAAGMCVWDPTFPFTFAIRPCYESLKKKWSLHIAGSLKHLIKNGLIETFLFRFFWPGLTVLSVISGTCRFSYEKSQSLLLFAQVNNVDSHLKFTSRFWTAVAF